MEHEEFLEAVQNHLKEREGCCVMVLVHGPKGMEIQCNFIDFAMQMGILDIAKMTVALDFEKASREAAEDGRTALMVDNIRDIAEPDPKKKVN